MGWLDAFKSKKSPAPAEGTEPLGNNSGGTSAAAEHIAAASTTSSAPASAPSSAPPGVRTGRRTINKAEMNPETVNVISAQKTNKRDLLYTGDSFEVRRKREADVASGAATTVYGEDKGKKCNMCCMALGGMVCFGMSIGLSVLHTGVFAYREQHRVRITAAKFCRHAAWMMIPPTLAGTTMHYFLCDALWSKRRNTFGMAWIKAVGTNTLLWFAAIALGTLLWRKGLRLTSVGSRIYYRYPAAPEALELRLIENPNALFTGMTWTYWALGVVLGQFGYLACAGAVVFQSRVHIMMSPVGMYATSCAPWWRREAIATSAGLTLKHIEEKEADAAEPE